MVWTGCILIISRMAVVTFDAKRCKAQVRSRRIVISSRMALLATGCDVGAQQRKPALLVYIHNIRDHPGIRGVAPLACKAYGLLMHIGMARHAFVPDFGKNQR